MEALQFDSKVSELSLIKSEIPVPGNDEVLIKVAFAGICGTDLHIVEGKFPCKDSAVTLGHEFCGTVEKVGSKVINFKKGDRVVVDPNSGCYKCNFCQTGNYHLCETGGLATTLGIYRNGGWANYCVIPQTQLYHIPDSVTLEQAALSEPLSCIAHGYDRIMPVPVGTRILIQGAGIIGNLWASVLHFQGHRNVIISEPQEERRKLVDKLETGFDCVSPEKLANPKSSADLFEIVIDCSGNARALENAMNLLQPGGKLCIFGVAPPEAKMSISPYDIFKKELTIIGVLINPYSFKKAIGFVQAMGSRYIDYGRLGIKQFNLKEYKKALQMLHEGSISKGLFKLE